MFKNLCLYQDVNTLCAISELIETDQLNEDLKNEKETVYSMITETFWLMESDINIRL